MMQRSYTIIASRRMHLSKNEEKVIGYLDTCWTESKMELHIICTILNAMKPMGLFQ